MDLKLAALLISIISLTISTFLFFRNLINERFNLDVKVIKSIEAPNHSTKFNRLFLQVLLANKSRLPVAITSIYLQFENTNSDTYKKKIVSSNRNSVLMYKTSSNSDEQPQSFYTDKVPLSLGALESEFCIFVFNVKDYSVRRIQHDNPVLVIETTRSNIEIPVDLTKVSIDLDEWLIS